MFRLLFTLPVIALRRGEVKTCIAMATFFSNLNHKIGQLRQFTLHTQLWLSNSFVETRTWITTGTPTKVRRRNHLNGFQKQIKSPSWTQKVATLLRTVRCATAQWMRASHPLSCVTNRHFPALLIFHLQKPQTCPDLQTYLHRAIKTLFWVSSLLFRVTHFFACADARTGQFFAGLHPKFPVYCRAGFLLADVFFCIVRHDAEYSSCCVLRCIFGSSWQQKVNLDINYKYVGGGGPGIVPRLLSQVINIYNFTLAIAATSYALDKTLTPQVLN